MASMYAVIGTLGLMAIIAVGFIAMTKTEDGNLLVSAYKGSWGKATIVALNRCEKPKILNIDWSDVKFKTIERANPYRQNTSTAFDGSKQIIVAPGEIVTITNVDLNKLPENFKI